MEGFKLYQGEKFNRISNEQTKLLFEIGTKEAKAKIFEGNLGLVTYVINRYFEYYDDKEELFQSGCVGLWKAILEFDNEKNYEFSTYATPKIHGEIRRYIRDYSRTIRPNRNITEILRRIDEEQEYFIKENESCRELSINELSSLLNEDKVKIIDAINYRNFCSLDDEVSKSKEGKPLYLQDIIPDSNSNFYEDFELQDLVINLIDDYDEKYQEIIKLYMGIGCKRKTQKQISKELNISQPGVSHVLARFKEDIVKKIHSPRRVFKRLTR